MKKHPIRYRVLSFMLCTILLLSNQTLVEAQSTYQEQGQYVTTNTYYKNIAMKNDSSAFNLNMLESIINVGSTRIETADSGKTVGRASVLNQALKKNDENRRVIGAINGDFFNTKTLKGLPTGLSIVDGEVRSAASTSQIFGVTSKGFCFIEKVAMNSKLLYRDKSINIVRVNKVRTKDEVALYTPSFEPTTGTDSLGTEIVIRDIQLPLKSNTEVVGTIYEVIKDTKNTAIPTDGVVISAHGKAAMELNTLNVGEKVSINLSFSRKDIQFAVTGMPRLLENKALSNEVKSWADAKVRHPRTAVGIKGGRVVMITVDGRQEGFSNGMNLYELADFLLSQGVENAINLDGGGSTTFVTRKQGDEKAAVVNSPSDVSARIVSNSIQIVSYAPILEPAYIKFNDENIKVFKGSNFKANFYTMDKDYNLLENHKDTKLILSKNLGTIKEDGTIKASTTPQKGSVQVKYGKVVGKIPVEVVDKVATLRIDANLINLESGHKVQLAARAYDEKGQEIFINPEAIKWQVKAELGKINAQGLLTVGNKGMLGSLTAKVGNAISTAEIKIGNGPLVMANFEDTSNMETKTARAQLNISVVPITEQNNLVKSGKGSLKFEYKFDKEEETSAAYLKFKEPIKVPGKPTKIGLWVYGNKSLHWLRATYINALGERKTINFTEIGGLDWDGWKLVTADISKDEEHPISIEQIYIAEPEADKKDDGSIILDELTAIYE